MRKHRLSVHAWGQIGTTNTTGVGARLNGESQERSFPCEVPSMWHLIDADVRAHSVAAQCPEQRPDSSPLRSVPPRMASWLARARRDQAIARTGCPGGLSEVAERGSARFSKKGGCAHCRGARRSSGPPPSGRDRRLLRGMRAIPARRSRRGEILRRSGRPAARRDGASGRDLNGGRNLFERQSSTGAAAVLEFVVHELCDLVA